MESRKEKLQRRKRKTIPDYTNSQVLLAINEYIHNDRNRKILKRRLIDGVCFEPLAEEFGLSVRQVKNIVYKSQIRLFSHI